MGRKRCGLNWCFVRSLRDVWDLLAYKIKCILEDMRGSSMQDYNITKIKATQQVREAVLAYLKGQGANCIL